MANFVGGRHSRILPERVDETGGISAQGPILVRFLVQFLRGFSYFVGITPPKPEHERRTAIALALSLFLIAALLALFLFFAAPLILRVG